MADLDLHELWPTAEELWGDDLGYAAAGSQTSTSASAGSRSSNSPRDGTEEEEWRSQGYAGRKSGKRWCGKGEDWEGDSWKLKSLPNGRRVYSRESDGEWFFEDDSNSRVKSEDSECTTASGAANGKSLPALLAACSDGRQLGKRLQSQTSSPSTSQVESPEGRGLGTWSTCLPAPSAEVEDVLRKIAQKLHISEDMPAQELLPFCAKRINEEHTKFLCRKLHSKGGGDLGWLCAQFVKDLNLSRFSRLDTMSPTARLYFICVAVVDAPKSFSYLKGQRHAIEEAACELAKRCERSWQSHDAQWQAPTDRPEPPSVSEDDLQQFIKDCYLDKAAALALRRAPSDVQAKLLGSGLYRYARNPSASLTSALNGASSNCDQNVWKPGDWTCDKCGNYVFQSWSKCPRCRTPRSSQEQVASDWTDWKPCSNEWKPSSSSWQDTAASEDWKPSSSSWQYTAASEDWKPSSSSWEAKEASSDSQSSAPFYETPCPWKGYKFGEELPQCHICTPCFPQIRMDASWDKLMKAVKRRQGQCAVARTKWNRLCDANHQDRCPRDPGWRDESFLRRYLFAFDGKAEPEPEDKDKEQETARGWKSWEDHRSEPAQKESLEARVAEIFKEAWHEEPEPGAHDHAGGRQERPPSDQALADAMDEVDSASKLLQRANARLAALLKARGSSDSMASK